jgi:chaperonin GroES
MKPLGNRILVQPDEVASETETGLIIPDTSMETPKTGLVLEVGPEVKTIKSGDRVAFSEHAGSKVKINGEVVFFIREADASFII